jgi:hypothetical protein
MHPHDPLALKGRSDDGRRRLKGLLLGADPNRLDAVPNYARVEASRNGFDFGEFGHAVRIQDQHCKKALGFYLLAVGRKAKGQEQKAIFRFAPRQPDSVC